MRCYLLDIKRLMIAENLDSPLSAFCPQRSLSIACNLRKNHISTVAIAAGTSMHTVTIAAYLSIRKV